MGVPVELFAAHLLAAPPSRGGRHNSALEGFLNFFRPFSARFYNLKLPYLRVEKNGGSGGCPPGGGLGAEPPVNGGKRFC